MNRAQSLFLAFLFALLSDINSQKIPSMEIVGRPYFLVGNGKLVDVEQVNAQIEFVKINKGLYQILLSDNLDPGQYGSVPVVNNANPMTGRKTT